MSKITKFMLYQIEIRRRFLRLKLECKYGSYNSRQKALKDLETAILINL